MVGASRLRWGAVIRLVMASALGLAMTLTRADIMSLLVMVWTFASIAIKQLAAPLVANAQG
jgi:hypothetical protein